MNPKQLKSPFKWEGRKPYCAEGVLHVPIYYQGHDPSLYPSFIGPVSMELCSGNGDWIVDKASAHPEIQWIAVEMQFCRVRKIWSKRENRGLKNLLIVAGMAEDFLKYYLGEREVDQIFVNFPDPWPKDRHAKHRLIQLPFAQEMGRVMRPGGRACLVTDDEPYSKQMQEVMSQASWKEKEEAVNPEGYGYSYFDNLWREKGKTIRQLNFEWMP